MNVKCSYITLKTQFVSSTGLNAYYILVALYDNQTNIKWFILYNIIYKHELIIYDKI